MTVGVTRDEGVTVVPHHDSATRTRGDLTLRLSSVARDASVTRGRLKARCALARNCYLTWRDGRV